MSDVNGSRARRICVVTGSRAEYGLLYWLMRGIQQRKGLQLQLIATGSHLSPEFGLTYKAIEADGFIIDRRVEMLLSSDSAVGIAKSTALGIAGMADALAELKPDLIVILGDRFEMLGPAIAAAFARIPVAHLHGGEATFGAVDEAIRHSITKMSHLHFTSTEDYRRRVIQLGESPERVFNVGAPGIDNIRRLALLSRDELAAQLNYVWRERNFLVTFHPATLDAGEPGEQFAQLLAALDAFPEAGVIFTLPNADADGRALIAMVREYAAAHSERVIACTSLGQLRYLSVLKHADVMIGNSSSGIIEAPALHTPVVNIGDRQKGRVRADSTIDCAPRSAEIRAAIDTALSADFQNTRRFSKNPYGEGGASDAILEVLANFNLDGVLKKEFHDLSFAAADTANQAAPEG